MPTKKKPQPAYLTEPAPSYNWDEIDAFMSAPAPPSSAPAEGRGVGGWAKDFAISGLKGAIGVPEAAVGLADMATGGRVGRFLENKDGLIGFRPKEAKAALNEGYSDAQKAANAEVQNADGFIDTAAAAIRNPSVVAQAIAESLPVMGAGGALARGAMMAAPRLPGFVAAGMGEGVTAAGSSAEQIRQESKDGLLTGKQSSIAAGSGALTGVLGVLGGKVAKSLGIGDIDTMIAGGAPGAKDLQKGFVRKFLEGAFSEGVLEELPQSVQEQVAQNWANDKPLDEGVNQAAVLGLLSGGAMGGAAAQFGGAHALPAPPPAVVPPVGPLSKAANVAAAAAVAPAEQAPPAALPSTAAALAADGVQQAPVQPMPADAVPVPSVDAPADAAVVPPVEQTMPVMGVQPAEPELPGMRDAFAQREADRPKPPTGTVEPGDLLNAQGDPFTTMPGAIKRLKAAGPGHELIRVANGLVVRKIKEPAPDEQAVARPELAGTAVAAADPVAEQRADGGRSDGAVGRDAVAPAPDDAVGSAAPEGSGGLVAAVGDAGASADAVAGEPIGAPDQGAGRPQITGEQHAQPNMATAPGVVDRAGTPGAPEPAGSGRDVGPVPDDAGRGVVPLAAAPVGRGEEVAPVQPGAARDEALAAQQSEPEVTAAEVFAVQDIPTTDKMREAVSAVGEEEFARQYEARVAEYRPTSEDEKAALVEATAISIIAKRRRRRPKTPEQRQGDPESQAPALEAGDGGVAPARDAESPAVAADKWTRMPAAEREAAVVAAGWKRSNENKPNRAGMRLARMAWADMSEKTRDKLAAGIDAPASSTAAQSSATQPDPTDAPTAPTATPETEAPRSDQGGDATDAAEGVSGAGPADVEADGVIDKPGRPTELIALRKRASVLEQLKACLAS